MTFLATDETQERQSAQQLAAGPGVVPFGGPATFEGFGSALGTGLGRGLAATGGALFEFGQKVDPFTDLREWGYDAVGLGDAYKQAQEDIRGAITSAIEYYRPDPNTTGAAGNLAFGVTSTLTPAVIGTVVGGPWTGAVAAGGATGYGTYVDLVDEGVKPEDAAGAATIEGALTGVGVLLPAGWGMKIGTRVATGAAANVALGGVERAAMGGYLEGQGYAEIAERYKVMDGQAIAIDAVLGAAFGALPADGKPKAMPATDDVDAALTLNSSRNAEIDVAPGIPGDAASRMAHIRAEDTAVQQLLSGEPVNVDGLVRDARFVEKPPIAGADDGALLAALRDTGYEGVVAKVRELEDALAARGRVVDEAPLPEMPPTEAEAPKGRDSAKPEDQAKAAIEARPEIDLPMPRAEMPARTGRTVSKDADGAEFTARTPKGEFRLVDRKAPEGADFSEFGEVRQVKAFDGDKEIGTLTYANDGTPPTIEVAEGYRRRGVATAMLKLARQRGGVLGEADTGIRGRAGEYRTEAGQAFRSAADESTVELTPARAADAMALADEAVADARSDGAAFQAAVNCFLRSGG